MAVARFYVHLVPDFTDQQHTKLTKVRATEIRQRMPPPDTVGMWIEINIEVPDGVFKSLVPRMNARLNEKAIEAMLAESSDLHARVVGTGTDLDA
jgi:hypothetical protein